MLVLAGTENKIKEPSMVLHTEHIWDKIKRNRVQKGNVELDCNGHVGEILKSRIFWAFKTGLKHCVNTRTINHNCRTCHADLAAGSKGCMSLAPSWLQE